MTFDPRGDFELVADGLETVTLDGASITDVLRRGVSWDEGAGAVEAMQGDVLMTDAAFHLSQLANPNRPRIGGTLVSADGTVYEVLGVEDQTLLGRWRLACRKILILDELDTRLTIMAARFTKGESGDAVAEWLEVEAGALGKVMPQDTTAERDDGQYRARQTAMCVLQAGIHIEAGMRVVGPEGTYDVVSASAKYETGRLQRITLEGPSRGSRTT